jgi:hypothetical protein
MLLSCQVWENWSPEDDVVEGEEDDEAAANGAASGSGEVLSVTVTEVTDGNDFFVQVRAAGLHTAAAALSACCLMERCACCCSCWCRFAHLLCCSVTKMVAPVCARNSPTLCTARLLCCLHSVTT